MGGGQGAFPRRASIATAELERPATVPSGPWFVVPRPVPSKRWRLFCFSYAGGNASLYESWPDVLPADVEVVGIELPGRRRRFSEAAFLQPEPLLSRLESVLLPHVSSESAFFGHSLGGRIAFELARRFSARGLAIGHLFVSGAAAPGCPPRRQPIHHLPDAEFLAELQELGGTPPELLQQKELMELLMPTLRADFTVAESSWANAVSPLDVDLTVFGGAQDDLVPDEDLEAWRRFATGRFSKHVLPGDHFFVATAQSALLANLARDLKDRAWRAADTRRRREAQRMTSVTASRPRT